MRQFRIAMVFLIVTLAGCSSMPATERIQSDMRNDPKVIQSQIISEYEDFTNIGPIEAVVYQIDLESNDLTALTNRKVFFSSSAATLEEVMREISRQLGVGLLIKASDDVSQKVVRGININAPVQEVIRTLETYANVDITFRSNTLIVDDEMTVQGMFSHLETDGVTALASMKEHLTGLLGDSADVMIDTMTGAFSITAPPNLLRRSRNMIETIINESTSSVLLRLHIYRINNSRVKEFGVNVTSLLNDVVSLSAGGGVPTSSTISSIVNKTWGEEGDVARFSVAASFAALEQAGVVSSVATPSLTLFNGITSKLSSTRTTGAWIPGEIQQRSQYIDGRNVLTFNEGRPTFDSEDIGSVLEMTPRVDLKNKQVHLNISYEESDVYDTTTTTWNRQEGNTIELRRPLKKENNINTRVVLQNERYAVVSGNRQSEVSMRGGGLPGDWMGLRRNIGTSARDSTAYSDTLIIARAYFPTFFRVVTINKFE